ncbi:hypothetical protein F4677DRAFT_12042 [Hypoxylon crocopeplum]|nr:hypothetical protein F4677DRAFT_12042 [Hypoxylon crocopeplum]
MRVSALFLASLAAVALAAPVEVPTGLSERQYDIAALRLPAAEDADLEKRQYDIAALRLPAADEVEKR